MTMPAEKPLGLNHRSYENRRASKPLMEKRRRARINQSLADLKSLIIDTVKKETQRQNTRHTKLEKADILEMTVTHLRNLHLQRTNTENESTFKAGFNECTKEVSHFLDHFEGIDSSLKTRLLRHLDIMTSPHDNSASTSDELSSNSSGSRCATPASAILDTPSCSPLTSRQDESPSLSPKSMTRCDLAASQPVQILANGQRFHNSFIVSNGSLYCYSNGPLDLASSSSRSRQEIINEDSGDDAAKLAVIDDSVWRPW